MNFTVVTALEPFSAALEPFSAALEPFSVLLITTVNWIGCTILFLSNSYLLLTFWVIEKCQWDTVHTIVHCEVGTLTRGSGMEGNNWEKRSMRNLEHSTLSSRARSVYRPCSRFLPKVSRTIGKCSSCFVRFLISKMSLFITRGFLSWLGATRDENDSL